MDRGQMQLGRLALGGLVALAIVGLLTAIILPTAVDALSDDEGVTLNQTVGQTDDVNANLNTTLDSVTSGTSATITLGADGETVQNTVNVGQNTTYSMSEGDVEVGVEEAGSDYAVANYTYPSDFGWSGGASSMWNIIGLAVVLAPFLFIIGLAMMFQRRT